MNRRVSEAGQSALARTCKTSGNLHFHVQNRQEWRMFPSHHEFGDTSGSCYNRQRLLFSWKAVPMPASLRHFENQGRRSDPEDYLLRRLQKDNRLDSRRKEPVGGQNIFRCNGSNIVRFTFKSVFLFTIAPFLSSP